MSSRMFSPVLRRIGWCPLPVAVAGAVIVLFAAAPLAQGTTAANLFRA